MARHIEDGEFGWMAFKDKLTEALENGGGKMGDSDNGWVPPPPPSTPPLRGPMSDKEWMEKGQMGDKFWSPASVKAAQEAKENLPTPEDLDGDVSTGSGVGGYKAGGAGATGKSLFEMSEEDKRRQKGKATALAGKRGARGLQIPTLANNYNPASASPGATIGRPAQGIRI